MPYLTKNKEMNLFFIDTARIFRNLVETVQSGIFIVDHRGFLVFVNTKFVEMLSYQNKGEMLGLNVMRDLYVARDDRKILTNELNKKGFVKDVPIRLVRKDGSLAVISVTGNFVRNENEQIIGVQGIAYDATDRIYLERELQREKEKLEDLLVFGEQVSQIRDLDKLVNFIVDKTSRILEANKCSLLLFDSMEDELVIKGCRGLPEEIQHQRVKVGNGIAGHVAKTGGQVLVSNIEYDERFTRKNQPQYESRSFMSSAISLNQQLIGVLNVADKGKGQAVFNETDLKVLTAISRQSAVVLENAKVYKELEYLSGTDPLTNLPNYRSFVKHLEEEVQRFHRFGYEFSLLLIDVDDFKGYNDTYGHPEGDVFLRSLSDILTDHLRLIDKVCRYGGDEFVVLLPGTPVSRARAVAERMRIAVEEYTFRKPMTISVGVVEYREFLNHFDFISRGDQALFRAKREGKNRVYFVH